MSDLSQLSDAELLSLAQQHLAGAAPVVAQPAQSTLQKIVTGGLSNQPLSPMNMLMGAGMTAADLGNKALGKIGYDVGGKVTDVTGSPGLGYATNVGIQAVAPVAASYLSSSLISPAMENTGKFLMRSALNAPLKQRLSGDAERAVGTLLDKGYNPTMGGVDAMREKATDLGKQVTGITNNSPYAFDPNSLYPTIREKIPTFQTQVNPTTPANIIRNSWDEFIGGVSNPLSVKDAQALKEGTYKALGDSAYGIKSSEETAKETAQKALARALRNKISDLEPQTAPLLAEQSDLLNAAKLAERRAGTDQGLKVAGIAPVANTMGKMLAMLLDKYTYLKSMTARGIYSGAERIPQAVGGATAALIQGLRGQPDQGQQP